MESPKGKGEHPKVVGQLKKKVPTHELLCYFRNIGEAIVTTELFGLELTEKKVKLKPTCCERVTFHCSRLSLLQLASPVCRRWMSVI